MSASIDIPFRRRVFFSRSTVYYALCPPFIFHLVTIPLTPSSSLTFTCTADACGHRSTHEFSKRAYTKGIVLVQCPQCKNRHLIADHLGWFKVGPADPHSGRAERQGYRSHELIPHQESTEEGTLRTVEDLLRAKGETVRTGRVNFDGDIEYDGEPSKAGP